MKQSRWRFVASWSAALLLAAGCGVADSEFTEPTATPVSVVAPLGAVEPASPAPASPQVTVVEVAGGLDTPWSLAFLPDGRMMVSERNGNLRIVLADGTVSPPLDGVPQVAAYGQGGLLDVRPGPDFAIDGMIFFTFAEPDGPSLSRTAVARARLADGSLTDVTVIFRQQPAVEGGSHYGSRIAFAHDGNLFVTLGDRYDLSQPQDLDSHIGKVIRIAPDGSVPPDNPFIGVDGALPEIWSYGHRNPQGAAIEPDTGRFWSSEHGPFAGDEINLPLAGGNYGWPLVSHGKMDGVETLSDPQHTRPGLEPAHYHWDEPRIAPSGMTFYTGTQVPAWRGDLFVGALAGRALIRLLIDDGRVVGEERLLEGLGERIRDVQMGPDGHLHLLTDSPRGRILRVEPVAAAEPFVR
jgi:aldose sugar dehydrogenase